jgi:PadR family transcriptional regulator PadR
MAKGDLLGEFEQVILLAILRLRERAYGMLIRQEIEDRTGRNVAIGAIYTTLERLEKKRYIKSTLADPTPERGGRAKRFFEVSNKGLLVLQHSQNSLNRMLDGINLAGETA